MDIPAIVNKMRRQRMKVVQSPVRENDRIVHIKQSEVCDSDAWYLVATYVNVVTVVLPVTEYCITSFM